MLALSKAAAKSVSKVVPAACNQLQSATRSASSAAGSPSGPEFDEGLLRFLVDPLSKAPLRYDPVGCELVCDEIGVAYPVIAGIPRLLPSAGRVLPPPDEQNTTGPSPGKTVEPWSQ